MKRRYLTFLLAVVCTLTAVLCGCGDGKSGAEPTNNGSSGEETGSKSENGDTTNGASIGGGEIVVGISQDLDSSLDPHQMVAAGTAGTREVLFNVFEGLVKPDSDGNLIPAVAIDWSIVGSTYTFILREGVLFHNGDTVTAEDVVYSINRCADASSETTYVPAFSVVKSVSAVDASTIVIELAEPDTEFLALLTVAVIPADYDGQAAAPVGTGPFRFVSYSPQESLVLDRFDDYWGEPAYLDKVTFQIIPSMETMIMSLNSGAIDIAAHLGVDQAGQLSSDRFNILEGSMNLVQALYLNHTVAPFDNVQVRKAMCYAVNVEEIMQVLADGRGFPTGSSMYPAFSKYFAKDLVDSYPYDPEKAVELLTEAGFPDGFSMTITVPSNYDPHVTTAQILVEQLAAVGITARIDLVEWTTWVSEAYAGHNFSSTVVGLAASTMTAQDMLARFESASSKNFIGFSSEDYDRVFAAARASQDDAEQVALYKQLQTILAEEAANVYLQDLCDLVAVNSQLTGYVFYPIYVMDLSGVRFSA